MESMQFAEAVVKEFLLFRGFTKTLHSFDAEVEADVGHGFQVDRIVDLLFTVYVPRYEFDNLIKLMVFLQQSFISSADARYHSTLMKLEVALKKYYIVNAVQKGQTDEVLSFFQKHGDSLLRNGRGDDWHSWFALPYMKHPSIDPRFRVYFSKEWLDTLIVSFRNFLSEVLDGIPVRLPTLLRLHNERLKSRALKQELEHMQAECTKLRNIARENEALISKLESECHSAKSKPETEREDEDSKEGSVPSDQPIPGSVNEGDRVSSPIENPVSEVEQDEVSEPRLEDLVATATTETSSIPDMPKLQNGESIDDAGRIWSKEEDVPHVIVESQETFSGHTSPITRCRFSTAGANVASASADGTVRIWTPDAAASTSRNATIYCGAEILALEWENKLDRLVLLGTAEGGLKAWNVEAKRVVCDLNTDPAFPRILELKCCPTDSVFLSVAASHPGKSTQGVEALGFGSLTVWNMRTWKLMSVLPLGEDPPVVTSVCFNHNGKLVAAGATDGMIRLFDMNGYLPITGWPAHDGCAVSCVRFGHDHSSIFSLGGDGKVLEWSLHNQGQILQSQDASMFCSVDGTKPPRHEMALDSRGRSLLLSSNLHSAPLFNECMGTNSFTYYDFTKSMTAGTMCLAAVQFNGPVKTYRTLNHSGAVTSVDWHPLLPMYLTGSSDHSVRVTTMG